MNLDRLNHFVINHLVDIMDIIDIVDIMSYIILTFLFPNSSKEGFTIYGYEGGGFTLTISRWWWWVLKIIGGSWNPLTNFDVFDITAESVARQVL